LRRCAFVEKRKAANLLPNIVLEDLDLFGPQVAHDLAVLIAGDEIYQDL
jgi:hypothetical protein